MRENDIYRWRYKPEREAQVLKHSCSAYWAKSCIGVVRNGRIEDTFWHAGDNISWTPEEAERELELVYLGNFDGLEKASEHLAEYYEESDFVNLNHSNSPRGNFYLRKGAQRSRRKMLEIAAYKLERAKQDVASAQCDVKRIQGTIAELESGADLTGLYL